MNSLTIDPENLRVSMLTLVLRVTAIIGLVTCIPSAYAALEHGFVGVALLNAFTVLLAFGLLFFKRLPFRPRAILTCLLFYALGLGLLISVGSVSQIYLFGFSIVVVLLLGLRMGFYAALLSSVSMLAVGALGYAAPEIAEPRWGTDFSGWVLATINFSLVNITLTLGVGTILNAVNTMLSREIASSTSLDQERTTLRALIDALPDVVFTKDTAGRFVNCNQATLALFGAEREDQVAGKTVFELFESREIAEPYHADDLGVMAGRKLINREERSVDSEGRPIWYLTIKVPLMDSLGRITGLIGVSRDITALKQAEAERNKLLEVAELARRQAEAEKRKAEQDIRKAEERKAVAEESNRAKSAFLAMMSHELRTPLNAIIGFSEVLIDGKFGSTNDRQARYLTNVLSSGRHLLGLINGLLDLSKIEAGKLEISRQPCSLRGLAEEALSTVQPLADAKQIELVMDFADPRIPTVAADPVRCKQVFYNLLSNSIKFTPKGGKVTVTCAVAPSGRTVRTSIADSGPGIKSEDMARLFKPFEQLDHTGLHAVGGTGLGLALSKQLVELMGGEVGVTSAQGQGSVFFFELPVGTFEAEKRVASQRVGAAKPLALIVEDDPGARELLELTLEGDGYETKSAATGESAIVLARKCLPAVIVLDVFLPGIDGWEVLKSLRAAPDTADIPVVMASISSDRQKAFALGAIEHLTKPVDREALLAALRRHGFTSKVMTDPVHVLAVDDEPNHRMLVRAMLEPAGFRVTTVESGLAGLEVAKSEPCDLLLLDLALPDISGVEIVAALRQHEPTRRLPIFLVTAQEVSTALRERLHGDVELILSKGQLRMGDLVAEINRVLGRHP